MPTVNQGYTFTGTTDPITYTKLNLVGWSQGGPRSAGWAAQHPDKVNKLVALSNTSAVRVPGTKEYAQAEQLVSELKPHLGKQMFNRLTELGAVVRPSTPAEFAAFLKKEDAKWGEVVRKGNIKLD